MYIKIKRLMDFLMAFFGLIILSPILLLICFLIKIDSKGPILFKQKRIGLNKGFFYIYKFRTMRIETPHETPTHLLKDATSWITKVGRFLRKTSLDELPQLLNILFGQMSFVGPRPALWNQYDLIEERDKYGANDVLPGITGLAQVNGRDTLSIIDKAKLDGEYVDKMGFFFDIKLIITTFLKILSKDGVVEGDSVKKD